MPISLDPDATWDYVLKSERDAYAKWHDDPVGVPPVRTVWILRPLEVRTQSRISDSSATVNTETMVAITRGHETRDDILRAGLCGVRDFYDAKGEPVPFETVPDNSRRPTRTVVTDRFLARISPSDRIEIADAITERNTLTGDERKN